MSTLVIHTYHPRAFELMGLIPQFLNAGNPDDAKTQFNRNYSHGGGWSPLRGWQFDTETHIISYPGDPPLKPVAMIELREERIFVYPYAWVAIVQKDGSYEVARMD